MCEACRDPPSTTELSPCLSPGAVIIVLITYTDTDTLHTRQDNTLVHRTKGTNNQENTLVQGKQCTNTREHQVTTHKKHTGTHN